MVDSTNIQREAPFLEDYRRRLMDSTFAAADQAITPQKRTIADFNEFQQAGFGLGAENMGYTVDPTTGKLTKTGQAVGEAEMNSGLEALQQAQKQYDPSTSNYKQFFNQYQSDVTQQALQQMDEEFKKQINQQAGQAVQGGVFGGSRYGVQEAEMAKNLSDIKSQRIFQDLSNNFQQAQGNAMNTFEQAQARNLGASQQYQSMGAQKYNFGQQGLASLMGIGQQQQTMDQAKYDENMRYVTAQQQEPMSRLGFIGDILSRQPSSQQTYTQQPIPYTNPMVGAVGAGIAGLGAYGSLMNPGN
mgnify:FL=1|tara:strand:- start:4641 stop:5543 length:903 start_codon:yes stop_codon:yes gene_type:complete